MLISKSRSAFVTFSATLTGFSSCGVSGVVATRSRTGFDTFRKPRPRPRLDHPKVSLPRSTSRVAPRTAVRTLRRSPLNRSRTVRRLLPTVHCRCLPAVTPPSLDCRSNQSGDDPRLQGLTPRLSTVTRTRRCRPVRVLSFHGLCSPPGFGPSPALMPRALPPVAPLLCPSTARHRYRCWLAALSAAPVGLQVSLHTPEAIPPAG
jgi:hypothetical protein